MRNFIEAREVVTLAMYKQRHPELAEKAERARNNLYLHEDTEEDDIIVIEVEKALCFAACPECRVGAELVRRFQRRVEICR